MEKISLVNKSFGAVSVTCLNHSYILSYPCKTHYECTEYQTTLNAGKYKLEVWGAEGGTRSSTVSGGKGGYSSGILTLSSPTLIFISIGSKGGFSTTNRAFSSPTFGGGGFSSSGYDYNPPYLSANGGGGTDIRIERNELESRIIVGGGGGGTGTRTNVYQGGFGGGLSGDKGVDYSSGNKGGLGGSQTTGGASVGAYSKTGSFGKGGNTTNTSYWGGGGGGGWFGGSNGADHSAGGGGGSGYVLTKESYIPSGYKFDHTSKFVLSDTELKSGNVPFKSPFETDETGHLGNGFAKITFLSSSIKQSRCCPCLPQLSFPFPLFNIFASWLLSK